MIDHDEISAKLDICSLMDIYCSEEQGKWGIWYVSDNFKFLVYPLELINSIFEDNEFSLFESVQGEKKFSSFVTIKKECYYYSWTSPNWLQPRYYSFPQYKYKIIKCIGTLYASMLEGKSLTYNTLDWDASDLELAMKQLNIRASVPSYDLLTTKYIKEEVFKFIPLGDEWGELYLTGIGDRVYKTWLTHWSNDYDYIRHQLENICYGCDTKVKLNFDMSDTTIVIKKVDVLDKINECDGHKLFKYKDYALVEIHPCEFAHKPVLIGYCNFIDTVRTLYEGLLNLAMEHHIEQIEDDDITQINAYNMFKSPLIERLIINDKKQNNTPDIREKHIKRIIKIYPDYMEFIIDSAGYFIDIDYNGVIDELYDKEGLKIVMPEFLDWHKKVKPIIIDSEMGYSYQFDWKSFHERGYQLALQLRRKLSADFDLWYCCPFEDKSGCFPKTMLVIDKCYD